MNRMICYTKCLGFLVFILLTSGTAQAVKVWQPLGPGPITGGQPENIPDKPQVGAINAIAPHPTNSNIMLAASVNGGLWLTFSANSEKPFWIPVTESLESLSMSDVSYDPLDPNSFTVVASHGNYSSYGFYGGKLEGVIRSTTFGLNWEPVADVNNTMKKKSINSVHARNTILLAAVDKAVPNTCGNLGIFQSFNTGETWSKVTTPGIPLGVAYALEADPVNLTTFYAGINYNGSNINEICGGGQSGIYKSTDFGINWSLVSNSAMSNMVEGDDCRYKIAVGKQNNLFVSFICDDDAFDNKKMASLKGVFSSQDGGSTWEQMDLPGTIEPLNNNFFSGIYPGRQGFYHGSLVADPTNPNIVYIGGDRQDLFRIPGTNTFTNSIGARQSGARLFRGDVSLAPGSQWSPITHSGTASSSAPHADSRDMKFDSSGTLLQSDDGGIYRMLLPRTNTSDWVSANGNIAPTESHSMAYDNNSDIVVTGNQDNGTSAQNLFAETQWRLAFGGDGGDVAIDTLFTAGTNRSIRYISAQFLQQFRRELYNQNNVFLGASLINPVVVGGAPLEPNFLTQVELNKVNGNRMIIGGANSVYESFDQGNTISEIGPGIIVNSFSTSNVAYGGSGSSSNEDYLYIGTANGVYVRTTFGAPLIQRTMTRSNGLAMNKNNPAEAFYIGYNTVFRTTNSGVSWSNITGNLNAVGNVPGGFLSIEFINSNGTTAIAVGTEKGAYIANGPAYNNWTLAADNLPNAPVMSLQYDPDSYKLIASTFGRGAHVLIGPLLANDAPVTTNDSISLLQGSQTSSLSNGETNLLSNDSDANSLTVQTIPVQQPTNGLVTINSDGTFIYQHDGSMTNTDAFYYRVCDNGSPSLCNDAKVSIEVVFGFGSIACSSPNLDIPDNNPTGITDTLNVMTAGSIVALGMGLEVEHSYVGDLIVTLTHAPTATQATIINRPGSAAGDNNNCSQPNISATFDDAAPDSVDGQCETPMAINGRFRPISPLNVFGNLEFSGNWNLTVTDGAGADTGALISWCLDPILNFSPVLDPIGNKSVNELETLTFTATATDQDTDTNQLTYSLLNQPTGASITSNGEFNFTPTSDQGPNAYTFDVVVNDNSFSNLSDSETITVTVNELNEAPTLNFIGDQSIPENEAFSFTATATDSNTPSNDLVFSLNNEPIGATISSNGLFNFTPTESQGPGVYTFDVIVSDDNTSPLTDSESIIVTVNEVNSVPQLNSVGNQSITALSNLSFTVTATDSDLPVQTLTFSLNGEPAGASITPNGDFSFTPMANQANNSYTFEVIVSDDFVPSSSVLETITIDVYEPSTAFCNSPNATIPDDATSTLVDTISINDSGIVSDIDISLDITHTWIGDLDIKLTHVASGTEVQIIQNPGGTGCSANNIQARFGDEFNDNVSACETVAGNYRPTGSLSSFDGKILTGEWRLTLFDSVSQDTGTLNNWCINAIFNDSDLIFQSGFQ